MRIIAIDPGYARFGIAILEKQKGKEALIYSDCFETEKTETKPTRLLSIKKRLVGLLEKYHPEELATEKLYFSKNAKTALSVAESRGIIIGEASSRKIPVFEYNPAEIKIAVTGYGLSGKRQVQDMVCRLLALQKKDRLDDEYDAIAIGLAHFAIHKNGNS